MHDYAVKRELRLFLAKAFPLLFNYLCRARDISAVGTFFDVVMTLPDNERMHNVLATVAS